MPRPASKLVRVVPARFDPDVACLIPAACGILEARGHFLNIIRHEHRRKWLAKCRAHWNRTRRAHGLRPLLPLRLAKRGGINQGTADRWLALASYDLHKARVERTGKGLLPVSNILMSCWLREHTQPPSESRILQVRKARKALKNLRSEITKLFALLRAQVQPQKKP
ncbi:MAG: hypothetical protein HYY24_11995 [Verrucomicrobia bacterium]|nr:hypothetical protein [Verrucomicrobiota bacterium]